MHVVTETYQVISKRRAEEYDSYQRDRLRTDEITQASEQLNGAMKNTFEYEFAPDGELYYQGQSLREVLVDGIKTAEELVKLYPQFAIELQRRHIELQQYEAQVTLAAMPSSDNPLVLVHISPTPDAVLSGQVDLNAYDRKRKKIMVRVSQKTEKGLKVTSFSLDRNDRSGLQAIAGFFGDTVEDDDSSEDILARNFLADTSQFEGKSPAVVLRQLYDSVLERRFGGRWYAGRQDAKVLHTLDMIERFPGLIGEHIHTVDAIKQRYGKDFRKSSDYEKANYNFLAAITQANELGEQVGSLNDAGNIARSAGVEFAAPDCPTGVAKTATEALAKQGIEQWKPGQCRVCLESGMVGACEVCLKCEIADDSGEDLDEIHRQALQRLSHRRLEGSTLETPLNAKVSGQRNNLLGNSLEDHSAIVRDKYGRHAIVKPKIGIGTTRLTVVNVLSGVDLLAVEQ